ncbi:MAG: MFS transporter [Acidobacteria bacterium]|nr:MAG: MFS transporter [Acidobacteriota bacterium]
MATSLELTRKTTVRWCIFLLILLIVAINYVDRASLSVAMPAISKEFGIDAAAQGIILSSFFWTYALMQIPSGWFADRYGPRLIIGCATILWGAFQALAALATGRGALLLARLGLGLAEGPVFPASGKLNAVWLPARERGRGAVLIDGGAPLGTAFGGLIIASLIGVFGSWRTAFVVTGLGTIAAGLFAYWYIRDNPREQQSTNEAEALYIETEHAKEDQALATSAADRTRLFGFLRFRSFWGMLLGWLGFNLVFYGLVAWAPNYLAQARHLSLSAIGSATFIIFGAGFVGEIAGGFLADYWKASGGSPNLVMRTVLGVSSVLTTLSTFFLAFVSSPVAAVALLSSTLFFLRWGGLYWSIPATLTDRGRAGVLGGIMNFAGNIGGILVPIIIGVIVQVTGSYFLALMFFTASGILYLVGSLVIDYSRKLPV